LKATVLLAGSIDIDESDDIVVQSLVTEDGNINLTAGGAIVGADTQVVDVKAAVLAVSAGGAITLNTQIDAGRFSTILPGDIRIDEIDAIILNNVTTFNGSIEIVAGGSMTASFIATSRDDGNQGINLRTTKGDITLGTMIAGLHNDVNLRAAGSIVDDGTISVEVVADELTAVANGPITIDTQVNSVDISTLVAGDIKLDETDDVTLSKVITRDGSITVTAGGTIKAALVSSSSDGEIALDTIPFEFPGRGYIFWPQASSGSSELIGKVEYDYRKRISTLNRVAKKTTIVPKLEKPSFRPSSRRPPALVDVPENTTIHNNDVNTDALPLIGVIQAEIQTTETKRNYQFDVAGGLKGSVQIILDEKLLIENIDYVYPSADKFELELNETPSAGQRLVVLENLQELFALPGQRLEFKLMRVDESGVEMTIKTIQAPNWVAFDEETGVLSLSPDEDVEPGLYPVALFDTDEQETLAQYTFEILVGSTSEGERDDDGKNGDQLVI
jgi:hypothetical protein